ncbi:MAG TPA: circularly permuted type 2 ATP-grasp protein [Steroidobacteraceae bacterium]|nr:circularly permuted type 2 ATP-grasp protein [Steroidobacteraceae bacterium]
MTESKPKALSVLTAGPVTPGWLAAYVPDARRYDELLDDKGLIRPHWQPLLDQLTGDDARAVARRGLERTRRLIVENGVTYNVYADPQGADRPWALDPVPLLLLADEWRAIEVGLAQRARLLDALLADIYGPQRLLSEGLVPPELVFGHPNYLWPCHGIVPRGGNWLHIYAADLARAPDGRWWLLADRTQAPSGAGYALENREIVEQVLPEAIRQLEVERVTGVFSELREQLLSHGDEGENPLAVILTPGPFNETYFEHAYLSRQLGVPLAEGTDLTVRDDTVYLKTLAGLKRVHTILRRLDDDFCDPLELRSGSTLGIPGLIGAVRANRVVMANALGTGVLESAAWLGFLPRIAERLLGEKLSLPSVATWWCGEGPALEYVLTHLDELVIKPTYPNQRFEPVFGRNLEGEKRKRLIQRLRARPYAYVAQEHLSLSQTPVWRPHGALGFAATPVAIRMYAVAGISGTRVMPGGLARVAADTAVDVVSTQRGGGSKDIWVLPHPAEDAVAATTGKTPGSHVRHDDIPSRLVENLYWFGRYTVRCEDKARLLRGTIAARSDEAVWNAAVRFCRDLGVCSIDGDPTACLRDDRNPMGVTADVRRLAWCASQVRTRLSASYWRAVNDMQRRLQESIAAREEPRAALDQLLLSLAALAGFAFDDMTQDEGWRLLRVGRRLERLQFAAGLLAQHLASQWATRQSHVEWLLEAYDSNRIYRSRYVVAPRLGPMLDLLVRDSEHPRALAFQYRAIARDLETLNTSLGITGEMGLDEAIPQLTDAKLNALEAEGADAEQARRAMADRLRALSWAAGQLSDRLSLRHFSHITLDAQALAT